MRLRLRGRVVVLASATAVALSLAVGGAFAVFPDSGVPTYTGCLTSGGTLVYVKEGSSPLHACASPRQVVKLSGGDVTRVAVTGALTGGGENGLVTIGLDSSKTVPTGCANGQVPKWDMSATPPAWSCGSDNDTTYTAGTGLDLTSGSFGVATGYRLPQGCGDGSVAKKQSGGAWACASDQVGSTELWSWFQATQNVAWTGGYYNEIHAFDLPAGTYLVNFTATAADDYNSDGNGEVWIDCELRDSVNVAFAGGEANSDGSASVADSAHSEDAQAALAMQGVVTLGSPGSVQLMCQSHNAHDHLMDASLTALRITTLHQ